MLTARWRIKSLIPKAGKADEAGLRAVAPELLARYAAHRKHPWWRRVPCVHALRGRVPEARVPSLLDRVRDLDDESAVRIALLEVLHDRVELLPWLREQVADDFGVYEACLHVRAMLGDVTAAPAIATLANSPWTHRRRIGEAALESLVARHGAAAIQLQVGDARAEDRVFQVRVEARGGADVTRAFADVDVDVARTACELVVATGIPDTEMLLDYVVTGPTMTARLWAMLALHRRGRDIRELWHALDCPRLEIAGLDDELRLAIVRDYPGTGRTDPRWLVEAAAVDLPAPPDEQAQLARVTAALDAAGLAPGPAREIGLVNNQGGGTYHVIETAAGTIEVSTLGRFVRSGGGYAPRKLRQALEDAGFRWIDPELGAILVTGLCVYYFGKREPLDIETLLFYWQD